MTNGRQIEQDQFSAYRAGYRSALLASSSILNCPYRDADSWRRGFADGTREQIPVMGKTLSVTGQDSA